MLVAAAMAWGALARLAHQSAWRRCRNPGRRTGWCSVITMVTSEMITRQTGIGNILFTCSTGWYDGLRHDRHHRRARLR